jgi:hypothetical protein
MHDDRDANRYDIETNQAEIVYGHELSSPEQGPWSCCFAVKSTGFSKQGAAQLPGRFTETTSIPQSGGNFGRQRRQGLDLPSQPDEVLQDLADGLLNRQLFPRPAV